MGRESSSREWLAAGEMADLGQRRNSGMTNTCPLQPWKQTFPARSDMRYSRLRSADGKPPVFRWART